MLDLAAIPTDQLRGMAQSAIGQSDFEGAETALREIIRRTPRDLDTMIVLARVQQSQGLRREALATARRAVGLAPKDWRAQSVLAATLGALGQLDLAARAYRVVIAARPDDPGQLAALGSLLVRLRKTEEARALATRALELDAAFGPALNLLGELDGTTGDEEAAERWLMRAVTDSTQPDARSTAWHRLGALRERQKRWDEAFQCHDRANRALLSTPAARHLLGVRLYDHLDHQYQPGCEAMVARWAAREFTDGPPDPVFLVGFPRSGTTMIENVLAALPGTITSDEEPLLTSAFQMAVRMAGEPRIEGLPAALDGLTPMQIVELRAEYWRSVARLLSPEAAKAKLLVDKAPLRFVQVLVMNLMFPRSRVIFVVRDPRDCCLSCYFQDFVVSPSLVKFLTLETTGDTYAQVMAFWLRARTRLTMPWMEVRYEDMVADFEAHARRLVEFVGRPWSDDVLRFHEKASGRAIRTPSFRAVTERVNTRAVGKWAHYEAHLGPLLERVRPFLDPLGYEE
jgi:Flp pilus assembly protein TadD